MELGCQMFFQTKNTKFGKSEGVAMEDVGIFCAHLVHFMAIWQGSRLFGTL
jgi:hypothetical protein